MSVLFNSTSISMSDNYLTSVLKYDDLGGDLDYKLRRLISSLLSLASKQSPASLVIEVHV